MGRCFRRGDTNGKGAGAEAAGKFLLLGATVILTFAGLWVPFALSPPGTGFHLDALAQIVKRLFPFDRGIFEGKVANLWCALSVKPFSIRRRVSQERLPLAALGLTLVLILPPCRMLYTVGRGEHPDGSASAPRDAPPSSPSRRPPARDDDDDDDDNRDLRLLLWGAGATALAFFLASFQVHEKGILLPLAPVSLLAADGVDARRFASLFAVLAAWSLAPLLAVDRLREAYVCCVAVFLCVDDAARRCCASDDEGGDIFAVGGIAKYVPWLSWVVMAALHVAEWLVVPPPHLPDLFPVLWSVVGCGLFCMSYLTTIWAMVTKTKQ